jgi:hypothetical protein
VLIGVRGRGYRAIPACVVGVVFPAVLATVIVFVFVVVVLTHSFSSRVMM